jgi:hypothetical protein
MSKAGLAVCRSVALTPDKVPERRDDSKYRVGMVSIGQRHDITAASRDLIGATKNERVDLAATRPTRRA